MAISTYKTFLMQGTGSEGSLTYEKLIDITSYPDLGGAPEQIDVTTLSQKMRTYIEGVQDTSALEFDANYDEEDFAKINALAGQTLNFAVWFGGTEAQGVVTPTGSEGKFNFKGTISAYVTGGGVNEAVGLKVTITPITVIEYVAG